MAEEKSKLIPFTKELEEAIEADAKRCHRSFVRQVVAVLTAYYETENVEINPRRLEFVGEILARGKKKIPIIDTAKNTENNTENKKKRSA